MSKLNIFLGDDVFEQIEGDIVAVDAFAYHLIEAGYNNFISIGDFDSCVGNQFEVIANNSKILEFPKEKDESDLELALEYAVKQEYDNVLIYNLNCGNRLDHFFNNIKILLNYSNKLNISFKDRYNYGYVVEQSTTIKAMPYAYISFIALTNIDKLIIDDSFKYPYNGSVDVTDTFFVSNELVSDLGNITIENGKLLILFTND